MMRLFGKKTIPLGLLDEKNAEVIWKGRKDFPDNEFLRSLSISLPRLPASTVEETFGVVGRELRHTISWADAYIQTEIQILIEDFVNAEKHFEILILKSLERAEINVLFKLSTSGIEGSTRYGIAWRRTDDDGDDLYFCRE